MKNDSLETPYITIDLDNIAKRYLEYKQFFSAYKIYYAVKANPHPEILKLLVDLGSHFDVASMGEIKEVLKAGGNVKNISFGNTIKKPQDIKKAYELGVRLFAVDSVEEIDKISKFAAGSDVFCRLLVNCDGAQWPLSRKFGCSAQVAKEVLIDAKLKGLTPRGFSFHVGSQQLNLDCWEPIISMIKDLFIELANEGIELDLINLGGGFPIQYIDSVPTSNQISSLIDAAISKYFPEKNLTLIIEPGRSMVGDSGVMCTEVVLISKKSPDDKYPWLYIDAGKFNGLIETLDESIRYKIVAPNRNGPSQKYIMAGPTCDSADVLYEKSPYELPSDIKIGDKLYIYGTGAYCSTYASICFNGFEPIKTYIKPRS